MAKKTKAKHGKAWTDKEIATLKREFTTCNSVNALAKKLGGRRPGAVRQKAFSLDLYRRGKPKKAKAAKKAAPKSAGKPKRVAKAKAAKVAVKEARRPARKPKLPTPAVDPVTISVAIPTSTAE